jgi:hypothetical protein
VRDRGHEIHVAGDPEHARRHADLLNRDVQPGWHDRRRRGGHLVGVGPTVRGDCPRLGQGTQGNTVYAPAPFR